MPDTPGAEAATQTAQPSEAAEASKVFETIAGSQPADERNGDAAPPATDKGTTQPAPGPTRVPTTHLQGLNSAEQREAAIVARRALERDGWDGATIDSLPLEKVLSIGAKARERQSDIDRKISKARELEEEYLSLKAERGDEETDEGYGDPDLDEIRAINPELADRLAEKLNETQEGLQRAEVERFEREYLGTVASLSTDYPQLADPAVEARVFARMKKLALAGEFEDIPPGPERIRRAVETAAVIELETSPRTMAQQRLIQRGDLERNGQPDTGRETGRDIPEDLESWAMAELRRGRKPDDVNQEFIKLREAQRASRPGSKG